MSNTDCSRTETMDSHAVRTDGPSIVDHPYMKYTIQTLVSRILKRKQRLELLYAKDVAPVIIEQELEIVNTFERVLQAKQQFLYRCMGISY